MIQIALIFCAMLIGHAIADRILQPPFLSQAKRHPEPRLKFQALALHGVAHGFFVALATGLPILGVLEMISHAAIDFSKGKGWIGTVADQVLHVACKLIWLAIMIGGFQ